MEYLYLKIEKLVLCNHQRHRQHLSQQYYRQKHHHRRLQ
jgi:hypothetical protein